MRKRTRSLLAVFLSLTLTFLWTTTALAGSVPRMSKEDLKAKLDDPGVIILDVRVAKDWKESEFKIKGAVRENPKKFKSWANKYPKDKTLVLYCA